MLKQRLLTAAVLIPVVVWGLLALPSDIVQILLALVAILAGWEWLQLIGIRAMSRKVLVIAVAVVLATVSIKFLVAEYILALALAVWLLATVLTMRYAHQALPAEINKLFRQGWFGVPVAAVILFVFVFSATWIHASVSQGPWLLLYVLVTVWLADTGGYFAGKRFGKRALARAISPNKTWEGVGGAQVLALVWAVLFYYLSDAVALPFAAWLGVTILIVMVSIVGDLFESVFKRCFQVKDSGNLLPGHGGMLDRIDSLLAAVPVFAATMMILGAI